MAARITQIGCGRWGKNVLRDLLSLGVEVTVVARGPDSVERARAGGATRIVADLTEAGDADGVVVVTPAPHHTEAIRAAAALGCPIFCEKPLVTDPADEPELMELCGGRLYVMHKWRWHPGIEALGCLAADGTLGTVTGVRSSRLGWGPFHFKVDSIDTLSPHDLSIGLAVLGGLPALRAAQGTPYPGLEGGYAQVSALFSDGPGEPSLSIECSGVSAKRLRRVEVTGTLGSAVLDDPEAPAVQVLLHGGELGASEADRSEVALEREWPLLRELRDFVAHCEGGPPPRSDGAEGFTVVRAIGQIRAALAGRA